MLFLSVGFVALFVICFILYYLVADKYRNLLLLAASAIFAGYASWMFLLVAAVISLFTYAAGRLIERTDENRAGYLLFASIGILVITWISFRYATSLIFPLGMSFYTFQAIGYLVDVYWGETKAERNIVDFSLFMLFFMKFLSGPIERGADMFAELKRPKYFNYDNAVSGMKLIFLGMFKKLLIANHIAPYTEGMFSTIHDLSGLQLLMTCLIYPIELYADFSGYTDIAIGGARMFGIRLSPNFNRPFIATSTADFWRRWHMSLSFWVRDYVYVPLTAELRSFGQWGVLFSLVVTFVALGIWHGAGWTFAIYGLIQGLIICYEMKVKFFRNNLPKLVGRPVSNVLFILRTYLLFALSLIFFRVESINDAFYFISHISFHAQNWKEMNIGMPDHNCVVAGVSILLIWVFEYLNAHYDLDKLFKKQPAVLRWACYFILVFMIFLLGKFDTENFIYIQF